MYQINSFRPNRLAREEFVPFFFFSFLNIVLFNNILNFWFSKFLKFKSFANLVSFCTLLFDQNSSKVFFREWKRIIFWKRKSFQMCPAKLNHAFHARWCTCGPQWYRYSTRVERLAERWLKDRDMHLSRLDARKVGL